MNVARNFSLSPQRMMAAARPILAGGVLVLLAACGGGGGSPEEPTPPVAVKNPPRVTILSAAPKGEVAPTTPISYEVRVENADSAQVEVKATCNGQPVPVNLTGIDKTGGTGTATPVSGAFPEGASCEAMVKVTAQNADGPATDDEPLVFSTPAAPTPLRYSVIMGVTSGGGAAMPIRISGESCAVAKVEEAVNKTRYPEVYKNFALFNSMLHTTVTPMGKLWVVAQVVAENNQRLAFHYNPVTNELTDDDGSLGSAPKYTPFAERDAGWVSQSESDHPDSTIGKWAQNEKLLVYVDRLNGRQPLCEDVVDGQRSGRPVALDISHDDFGGFIGFWHFTH